MPVVVVVGLGLVLLAAAVPGARFDDIGVKALPESSETRQVAEAIDARFPSVTAEPVEVVADVDPDDPRLAAWVADVEPPAGRGRGDGRRRPVSGAGMTVVEVHAEGETNGRTAQAVVREVRALDPGFPVLVGGDPAEIVDFRDSITARLPLGDRASSSSPRSCCCS